MRLRIGMVALLVIATMLAACGEPENAAQDGAVTSEAELAVDAPASTPAIGVVTNSDEMIAEALEFSRMREVIASGEPQPLLAIPATPYWIHSMGINIGNWEPQCDRPMYLVILKGDFDGSTLFVNPGGGDKESDGPRGTYIGYVFDLNPGVPGNVAFSVLSDDGAVFKRVLGDSELPDWDIVNPEPEPPYIPCEDVVWEGNPDSTGQP